MCAEAIGHTLARLAFIAKHGISGPNPGPGPIGMCRSPFSSESNLLRKIKIRGNTPQLPARSNL
jgi:hypothetical protein